MAISDRVIHKVHTQQEVLSRDLDKMKGWDVKVLQEKCSRQREQQTQRPWSGTSLVYLRNRKKVNVVREERLQGVGKEQTVWATVRQLKLKWAGKWYDWINALDHHCTCEEEHRIQEGKTVKAERPAGPCSGPSKGWPIVVWTWAEGRNGSKSGDSECILVTEPRTCCNQWLLINKEAGRWGGWGE